MVPSEDEEEEVVPNEDEQEEEEDKIPEIIVEPDVPESESESTPD